MDTETRAAIERLRAYFAEMDATSDIYAGLSVNRKHYPGTEGGVKRECDLWKMAKFCLSLVRADDAEAINEDWLRECGFCRCSEYAAMEFEFGACGFLDAEPVILTIWMPSHGEGWHVSMQNSEAYEGCSLTMRNFHTKGDLRQLMRGFGQEI